MPTVKSILAVFLLIVTTSPLLAATYVVPSDGEMVRRSDAIVVGKASTSYTRLSERGGIETVTPVIIEETIKGAVFERTIDVVEPGGTFGDRSLIIPGVPRFEAGQRLLLMVRSTDTRRWTVTDLALGKFVFATDEIGQDVVIRQEGDIRGWDLEMRPYTEKRRSAEQFLSFLRAEARRETGTEGYFVPARPLQAKSEAAADRKLQPAPNIPPYTASSYTFVGSPRWNIFPSGVTFVRGTTTFNGAETAVNVALGTWTGNACSNVNLVFGGVDSVNTGGLTMGQDAANTILFERNFGAPPFSCASGGTLGIGGVWTGGADHSFGGEMFSTVQQGDVEMNQGLSGCTTLINNGDLNSAVAHEVGHAIGFRHLDEDRNIPGGPCTPATLECATAGIMKSFISNGLNGALLEWDNHAVEAVYPEAGCVSCTPPSVTGVSANPTTIVTGESATLSVTAGGTSPTFQWFVGTTGDVSNPVPGGTVASISVSPTSTTSYWVQVTACAQTANSLTVTVTVGPCPTVNAATPSVSQIFGGFVLSANVSGGNITSISWFHGSPPGSFIGSGVSVTVTPSVETMYFYTATNSCGNSATSPTVTVTPQVCDPPVIQSVGANTTTITPGGSATLSVNATGSSLQFQWFQGNPGNTTNPVPGGTASSIIVSPTTNTTYWVRVTSGCGAPAADSAGVTITISTVCTAPTVSQPANQKVSIGSSATLTVTASGQAPLTYQWFRGPSGNTSSPVGTNSDRLNTGPLTANTQFWVRVTNGCGTSADSGTIAVEVLIPKRRAVRRGGP